ncbi:MAG: D-2-hydroxyacid dehydrogenase [Hyphomicrobiales bacterium]|nr:D-2-hydroxyacid dehydrogenase [Hyphomicrobiales bacterium]
MKLVVQGAKQISDVPGLQEAAAGIDIACAPDVEALAQQLPGADVMLGWDFRGRDLADCWHCTDSLKWIHWGGAGVDAALFPELVESDVMLTNARGIFDRAMAEYVLGYMLSEAKLFRQVLAAQSQRHWQYRMTDKLAGQSALVFGVGSIGREIARVLKAMDLKVSGVGRTARPGDDCFETIHAASDAGTIVGDPDWVIGVMPSTPETERIFDAGIFTAMKPTARFINVGRGCALDENALLEALSGGAIAGAMLDVFDTEPLPPDNPLWTAPNLFVSPHISGDYKQHKADMAQQFIDNLVRYQQGQPLINTVNKQLGFVSDPS